MAVITQEAPETLKLDFTSIVREKAQNILKNDCQYRWYTLKNLGVFDEAFQREKQIQGWNRKKKQALIAGDFDKLSHLSCAKSTPLNPPFPEPGVP